MRGATTAAHFDHVVSVLADAFGWDDITRDVCRSQLARDDYTNGFPPWFEFICDEPVVANWRLKADRRSKRKHALRIAYYGGPDPDRQARVDAINKRLARTKT